MEQAVDFLKDSRALYELMWDRDIRDFKKTTNFKNWTISDVFGHLYVFNIASIKTLESANEFENFFKPFLTGLQGGKSFLELQKPFIENYNDRELFKIWWQSSLDVNKKYLSTDPKIRVSWAGPTMSARSSITARQMETWAHGQEIFDCLGVKRVEGDQIKNIVHLGISTFGWTFINRQLALPKEVPYVSLILPSGAPITYNKESNLNFVTGSAVEFAQVVTQTRNIQDTSLKVKGLVAKTWMSLAQCFAGKAEDPPAKGQRFTEVL